MTQWHNWYDWRNSGVDTGATIALKLFHPPCPDCMFWNPHIAVYRAGLAEKKGIILDNFTACTAMDMEHDFSCFRARGQK